MTILCHSILHNAPTSNLLETLKIGGPINWWPFDAYGASWGNAFYWLCPSSPIKPTPSSSSPSSCPFIFSHPKLPNPLLLACCVPRLRKQTRLFFFLSIKLAYYFLQTEGLLLTQLLTRAISRHGERYLLHNLSKGRLLLHILSWFFDVLR